MKEAPPPSVNPYAAPRAELLEPGAAQATRAARFYGTSPLKVAVLSALTVGLYDLVFWWRHWRVRRQRGEQISVLWRTIFAPFMAFEFKNTLAMNLAERDLPVAPTLANAPLVYFVSFIVANVLGKLIDTGPLALIISVFFVVLRASVLPVIQQAANTVLTADGNERLIQRGATLGTYAAGVLGLVFWGLIAASQLFPEAGAEAS